MKARLCILIFTVVSLTLYSQSPLSKDSVRFYQKQLNELYQRSYDSLRNSKEYKFLTDKLKHKGLEENFGVELVFIFGIQFNQYTNLNERLASLGLHKINTSTASLGVGLSFRFNKIIVGYDMNVLIGDNGSGGYLHAFVSTNLIKTGKFIFSPQIGYGGQNITHRYLAQSSSTDFNSYFTTSPNKVEIDHSSSVIDFAMAFKLCPKTNYSNYLSLFRIGYRHALSEEPWKVANGNSANAPTDRNSNFYLQLVFGVGD